MNLNATLRAGLLMVPLLACASTTPAPEPVVMTPGQPAADPRPTLRAGMTDAGVAIRNMELVSTQPRPAGFFNPNAGGDMMAELLYANSDMAFRGNTMYMGSFQGFQIWDISNPASPRMTASLICPGGQGDVSVYRHLLFMSVEMPNGRVDCGTTGQMNMTPSADRFRGVRVFDITNPGAPRQVAAIQTCRGSHTHTLVTDPRDAANVYIYVSGASFVRPAAELAGCSDAQPDKDPNTSLFRIEVIKVPLNAPQTAAIVNMPRIFANESSIAGLWRGGSHGEGTQSTATTDQCHDITAYPALGLAAGACSGNGILLDISDPANPKRIAEVSDPNFAYWHSATFNNDGSKVLFTDEWGGGMAARCQASNRKEWGADAIFTLDQNRRLTLAGYYKLPAAQGKTENCVAHNGSLVPVPGRDILAQAWYQGGISVVDFTDPKNPIEIAYFDRGPYSAETLNLGGFWSSYWYNGYIYGSEIGRGLDVFKLTPSEHLSANEIAAANLVRVETFNPQHQERYTFPASFVVARAYIDQIERSNGAAAAAALRTELARAEGLSGDARRGALNALISTVRQAGNSTAVTGLVQSLTDLAR